MLAVKLYVLFSRDYKMSRVGKGEINIPNTVSWSQSGQMLSFKGKLGAEDYSVPEVIF